MKVASGLALGIALLAATAWIPGGDAVDRTAVSSLRSQPVFAAVYSRPGRVAKLHSRTMRPIGGSAEVGFPPSMSAARSPDGKRLAVGSGGAPPAVAIVDLGSMRALGVVKAPGRGSVEAVSWPSARRILFLVRNAHDRVVTVDPVERRIVTERRLTGSVVAAQATRRGPVLLLAPRRAIGPARLAVASGDGRLRLVELPRIVAGWNLSRQSRVLTPALAVDPAGTRAVVVSAGQLAADVDLRTLAVRLHDLRRPRSLLGRLLAWLEPAAEAKSFPGSRRSAVWIDRGHVAVTGSDTLVGAQGRTRLQPAGAWLVDTRAWRARKLLAGTSSIAVAGNTLLAWGGTPPNGGLTAFSPDGTRRFRLLRSGFPPGLLQVRGNYAYLADGSAMSWQVIDVREGRVVATARTAHTTTLLDVR